MKMSQPNFAVVIYVQCEEYFSDEPYTYEHKVYATTYTLAYAKALLDRVGEDREVGGYVKPLTTRGHLQQLGAQQARNADLPF